MSAPITFTEPGTDAAVQIEVDGDDLQFIIVQDPDMINVRQEHFFVYMPPAARLALARALTESAEIELEPRFRELERLLGVPAREELRRIGGGDDGRNL